MIYFACEYMTFIYNSWVCCPVRVTRRVKFNRAGAGTGVFFYPCAGTDNPTNKILTSRVRVQVATTRRVHTRCHFEMKAVWTISSHETFTIFIFVNTMLHQLI